jgi:hypothetical protein
MRICVRQVMMLADGLRSALSELPSVTVWDLGGADENLGTSTGDQTQSHRQCGLVTFSVQQSSLSTLLLSLRC